MKGSRRGAEITAQPPAATKKSGPQINATFGQFTAEPAENLAWPSAATKRACLCEREHLPLSPRIYYFDRSLIGHTRGTTIVSTLDNDAEQNPCDPTGTCQKNKM